MLPNKEGWNIHLTHLHDENLRSAEPVSEVAIAFIVIHNILFLQSVGLGLESPSLIVENSLDDCGEKKEEEETLCVLP